MNTHNSQIRICIILQLFTNLPEVTTLYEVCSNIFNRAKPSNKQVRRLHRHICLHLGIEESSETNITDLPHLLLGHYSSDTMITLPFTCAFSLSPFQMEGSLDEPKVSLPLLPPPPEYVSFDTPVSQSSTTVLPPLNLTIERPIRPPSRHTENHLSDGLLQLAHRIDTGGTQHTLTLTYPQTTPATTATTQSDSTGTPYASTSEYHANGGQRAEPHHRYNQLDDGMDQNNNAHATGSLTPTLLTGSYMKNAPQICQVAPLIHDRIREMREQSNTSEIEYTSEQIDDLLRSSSEEPGSPIHFPVPPPDAGIERQVQNKLLSKRRKTNSSAQSLKKIKITIAPIFPSYNAELAMQEVYTKISPIYETDATDLHTLLSSLDNTSGHFALEIFQRSATNTVTEAELDFMKKHKPHILYVKLKDKITERLANTVVVEHNISLEELEEFSPDLSQTPVCNDCRTAHESRKVCIDRLTGGPSLLSVQNTPISYTQLSGYDAIIYGLSPTFRNIETNLLDHVLNMSPPTLKFATGPMTRSLRDIGREYYVPLTNTLFHDLVTLIERLDTTRPLPIFVEFRPKLGLVGSGERLPIECDNFIRTLALLQKRYTGLIIGLSPTPYWIVGMDIATYQVIKTLAHKAACYLTGFGLAAGVYVITCDIASLPIGGHPRHYTLRKRFKRSFIFDKQGHGSREGRRRLCNDLETEMRRIASLNSANLIGQF